ncbi:sulfite reductase subunit alpha [Pseudoxanthomonas kalamensis DSM 18571]|uniref:sulfite reductase subunit alpha n=1 Tax=Pseudoxanthomonas kalamensis TaxID=289483 RepID=UPI001391A749|nr:sulfite reductase subunit alpha [Pseudoxanthomonas kalamensis]KAF1711184.1 sulfite reductase subunit alpha [Pseudoxanthomonas kalamensis DSM 18571]
MNAVAVSDTGWRSRTGNALVLLALAALALMLLRWQGGEAWPLAMRPRQWAWAGAVLLAYLGGCAWLWQRTRPALVAATEADADAVIVAWASQTGFAHELAQRTAEALDAADQPVQLLSLSALDAERLSRCRRALFVVSTTGEGDPPDHALAFAGRTLTTAAALPQLQFAVLALGDREYTQFCAFGHRLEQWLRRSGARPLFDLVEVNNGDAGALRHWQHQLGQWIDATELPDWAPADFEPWRLHERRLLNPGSQGGAAYYIALSPPPGASPQWQAGDIVEIGPRNAPAAVTAALAALQLPSSAPVRFGQQPTTLGDALARSHLPLPEMLAGADAQTVADALQTLPSREYSIASLPADGELQLLLRRMLRPDGSPGVGSGWLCDHAEPGGEIAARIRSNPNFHPPETWRPLILIGNGTGIAGLRALLKSRVADGARRNWLIFGERQRAMDFFHGEELLAWQSRGWIERMDLAFSRDDSERKVYVQDRLREAAADLRRWLADGTAVYVCGSQAGMAPAVDAVLRETLGDAEVETMLADGRYHRDVY